MESPRSESPTSAKPTQPQNVLVPDLQQGQHVCLIGKNGSGKTVLAEAFLSRQVNVVAIDPKHQLTWRAFQTTESLRPILALSGSKTSHRWIFRPRSREHAAQALELLYAQGGWTLYVDEVYGLSKSGNAGSYPESFVRCLTRGRSRGITVWSGMQRPTKAPLECFTEAWHFFIFRVTYRDDRKRVAEYTDERVLTMNVPRFSFIYYEHLGEKLVLSRPLRKDVR